MSTHPVNLIVSFLLEISALGVLGYWVWLQGMGIQHWILVVIIPLIAIALWGHICGARRPSSRLNSLVTKLLKVNRFSSVHSREFKLLFSGSALIRRYVVELRVV